MEKTESRYYRTRLRSKGRITLPKGVRDLPNLEDGHNLIFSVNDDGYHCTTPTGHSSGPGVVLERALAASGVEGPRGH